MNSWPQPYDPLGSATFSTLVASLPVLLLLGALAFHKARAHWAAILGLVSALGVAIAISRMPVSAAIAAAGLGAAYGLFPIGWILVNVLFLYRLAVTHGAFDALQDHIAQITTDRRLQLVLVAFALGAFFEGAAGFGTPVAITSALLVGLGFDPLESAVLSLLANTAPVAFGALGTPIIALAGVTGLDVHALSAMVAKQLPPFSLIVPFWLVAAYSGWRGMLAVWPALLVAGLAFAVPQYLVATHHGPWLVDIIAALCSMASLALFLRLWTPADAPPRAPRDAKAPVINVRRAWMPWIILALFVFAWGTPAVKTFLNGLSSPSLNVPALHLATERTPPVVAVAKAEPAIFTLNWLSATGTAIFFAGLVAGLSFGAGLGGLVAAYRDALQRARIPLLTIAAMFGVGFVMRYAGLDAILGLAFAKTGPLYPFFGTMLGWLGVALTGSDTSSNVLFGSLQVLTANQLGVSAVLMAAANSAGGVMGKMIDAQSIVVAGAATGYVGHEGRILRRIFFHSLALAMLVAAWVMWLA